MRAAKVRQWSMLSCRWNDILLYTMHVTYLLNVYRLICSYSIKQYTVLYCNALQLHYTIQYTLRTTH